MSPVRRAAGFTGRFDRTGLADIYRRLDAIEPRKVETVSFRPKIDLFWLPLAAIVLLSFGFQILRLGFLRIGRARRHAEPPEIAGEAPG